MITVYAEKFSVGAKIAAALQEYDVNGVHVSLDNIDKVTKDIERPCKKKGYIEVSYKGEDYAVTWGQGHMYGLYQAHDYDSEYADWKKIPIPYFPEKYELKIREGINRETKKSTGQPDAWTKAQLAVVKSLFESSDYVVSATDDDREGQLIFAYVYEMLGVDVPYKRMSVGSMTKDGLRKSFDNLIDASEVESIENAGRGRNIADWIVGVNLTTAMTLKYSAGPMLSIGRVQTPTLAMIVKREKEILNFKSHPFWNVVAEFETKNGEKYVGKHERAQIEDKSEAERILKKVSEAKTGKIVEYKVEPSKREVPLLYNLTSLSIDANNKYSFTAQHTLDIAQELYMAGFLTYPRTKSQCLSDDMKADVDEVLDMLSGFPEYTPLITAVPKDKRNYTKRHFNSKKVESHDAIIPTNSKPHDLTDDQKKIYDLCARSLIRIIYGPASLNKISAVTEVDGELFKSSGSTIIDGQWLCVNLGSNKEEDSQAIPVLTEGEDVSGTYVLKEGKTEPPKRYTDATLQAALRTAGKEVNDEELRKIMMEQCDGGIGTEATRPGIIETVVTRFCERKGKSIVPKAVGIELIDITPVDDLKSPELTARFESMLNDVAEDRMTLDEFLEHIKDATTAWCDAVKGGAVNKKISYPANCEKTKCTCPVCGKPMVKYKWGWSCEGRNFRDKESSTCNFCVLYEISGVTITDKDIETLLKRRFTKFFPNFKKRDGSGTFGAMLMLDDSNAVRFGWNLPYTCPICGKPLSASAKAWSCTGYKEGCKFAIWNTVAGKNLLDKDKIDLLEKGKTRLITGFKSKQGKDFDAYLVMDDENKVTFEFPKNTKKGDWKK